MEVKMKVNRRDFIRLAGAGVAAPLVPGCFSITSPDVPGGKVRLAVCGIANQGWNDIRQFERSRLCEIVALCDTDLGAKETTAALKRFPKARTFRDFRKMLDAMAGRLDAVAVCTPDFSHFPLAMAAMRRGLAVYVEKPLAHTFEECALLLKAARKYGVVTQMGNQGHSEGNFFQMREYVKAGVLDPRAVTRIVSHMNYKRRWHKWGGKVEGFRPAEPVPATLDWDTWLGTSAYRPYARDYVKGDWRCWYAFGCGCLGDWGAHVFDTVHEFCRLGLPTEVRIRDITGWNPYVYPLQDTLVFRFPETKRHRALDLEWYEGQKNLPPTENLPAKIDPRHVGREIYMADGSVWYGTSHGDTIRRLNDGAKPDFPKPPCSHYANFLRAVRGDEKANSPFEVAAPLSQVMALGCIAQRLRRGFRFDPARGCSDDGEVNGLLSRRPRKGWEDFYRV